MKKLFILCALVLSFSINAQDEVPQEKITETERIIDKYGGKIIESFNDFAESATPYAKEGFEMVVRLQIAKGIGLMLPLIIFIICVFTFRKEYTRIENILKSDSVPKYMDSRYGVFTEDNSTPTLWISLVSLIIFGGVAIFTTYSAILRLIAPEWYAIKEIIELF